MAVLRVTGRIAIDEDEIEERFVLAGGPGGQNVNKVATAVELRFDVGRSPSLTEDVRKRLMTIAGQRMTRDSILVILARRFRTQARNRADARERLVELIRRAARPPVPRRATRPTLASKRRRLEDKKARASVKRERQTPRTES